MSKTFRDQISDLGGIYYRWIVLDGKAKQVSGRLHNGRLRTRKGTFDINDPRLFLTHSTAEASAK